MQSTLGFAPTPEDLADERLFDSPVVTMRLPRPAAAEDEEAESGEP